VGCKNGLASVATGGRPATTLAGSLVMMAKKVTKRPVSKGFGAKKEIKGNCVELKDAKTVNLMDWLKSGGASVSKVAIADFKGLRGVAGVMVDRMHTRKSCAQKRRNTQICF
jgi:hypothetical protein